MVGIGSQKDQTIFFWRKMRDRQQQMEGGEGKGAEEMIKKRKGRVYQKR